MAVYCYRCPECGEKWQDAARHDKFCPDCLVFTVRDYKAEAVGVALTQLRKEREK